MIEAAIAPIRGQLEVTNQQLEAANQRADRADQRSDRLHDELVEARAAERKAIDLVRYATAEASDQRKRADDAADAERIAREDWVTGPARRHYRPERAAAYRRALAPPTLVTSYVASSLGDYG